MNPSGSHCTSVPPGMAFFLSFINVCRCNNNQILVIATEPARAALGRAGKLLLQTIMFLAKYVIFFCAPLLRQLPLCSPLCHPLSTEKSIFDGGSHVLPPLQLRNSARV